MIDVAGLGQPDHGVDHQHPVHRLGGALGEFLVNPVQGISGLERNHVFPPERLEPGPGLGRVQPQVCEVMVHGKLDDLDRSRQVERCPAGHLGNHGVLGIRGAEHLAGDLVCGPLVDVLDRHGGEKVVVRAAQGDLFVQRHPGGRLGRQRDGYGEQPPVGEPHVIDHAAVVIPPHEAVQGGECAGGQQLEVAHRAGRELDRGQGGRVRPQLGRLVRADREVDQLAPVWGYEP